ncbi:hypothetical protein ANN_07129 [Periplaneta americana]|uniref:Tc1-like transposase DDE domain-containing protein n=1 Tax=Periplaneta americana TaxID=6978 RepID=A0ABQ8THF9_PERAM|nr:hypothetical protein ANN_07129 [Periplaneta americana]
MSPGSSTESYPAFAHIGLRGKPRKKPQPGNLPQPGIEPGPRGFEARRASRYSTGVDTSDGQVIFSNEVGLATECIPFYKICPVTSYEVETTFSAFKFMLNDRRLRLRVGYGDYGETMELPYRLANGRSSSSRWHLRRSNCIGITVPPHIWCGIVGNQLLGPRVLPPRLNGEICRAFFERELHGLLHDIPLATRVNLWFMHDGAPEHYCRNVRAYLNAVYPGQWIGRAGPTLGQPDHQTSTFWGRLKSIMYAFAVSNVEVLQQRIEHACKIVCNELNRLCNVQKSLRRRPQVCLQAEGQHFEHTLH